MPETKRCCHCEKLLPISNFAKNKSTLDGLQYRCRECHRTAIIKSKEARKLRGDKPREWDHFGPRECVGCLIVKPIEDFHLHSPSKIHRKHLCKQCIAERAAKKAAQDPERMREIYKRRYAKDWKKRQKLSRDIYIRYRNEAFVKLGNKCCRCGFEDERALQIDHVNGRGNHEVRNLSRNAYFKRVIADTEGRYQLLCANCNWIKRAERNESKPRRPRMHPTRRARYLV